MTIATLSAPPRADVRRAGPADVPALARVLADAFYDDPAGRWFLPDARTRRAGLERFFGRVALERVTMPLGEVLTSDDRAGAALWMPPGSTETSTLDDLRLMPALARASRRHLVRVLRGMAAMDAVHPHEPHWYLPQIGVASEHRGRGIGSALLQPVLDRCDAERVPAYLEATSARNRALYERHGFEAYDVLQLPQGGPALTLMWREPS